MKKIIFNILTVSLLSGCGGTSKQETANAEVAAPAAVGTVSLTRDQLQRAGIEIGQAENRRIAARLTANGTVAVLPEGKATVTAKIGGRIEQFYVHEGQTVQKGQALLRIASNQVFDIQQAYLQAKADLIFLEKELERQKTLSGQQVGATKNYEEVQSKYARAKGDLQTAVAKLQYLGMGLEKLQGAEPTLSPTIIVTAPISGNITEIPLNLGASVGEGTILCSIIGLHDLHAHVEVFAKDIGLVKIGQSVGLKFPNLSMKPIIADIEYINRDMNPTTMAYSVHVHLPFSKDNLFLPGMPVVADIQTQSTTEGMALPESAVLHSGKEWYCFVIASSAGEALVFQKITFEPTLSGGGYVGVPAGLLEGKQVVLRNAHLVDGEMRKGEMEE